MRKEKITIKKYRNRRLYNMDKKKYITLDDLTELVQEGYEVEIIDSTSGDDITQSVLIQIILEEQKEDGYNLFSNELLHQLIQYRNQSTHDFFQRYLPGILDGYIDWQQQTQSQFMNWAQLGWNSNQFSRNMFTPNMGMWGMPSQDQHQQNPENYKSSQEKKSNGNPSNGSENATDEVKELKKRIEEMENLLKKASKKD